jgi:hypothetical protein
MILGGNEDANDSVKSVTGWLKYYIMGNSKETKSYALDYYEKLDHVSMKFLAISHMCMDEESINPAKVAEEIGNIHLAAKTAYIDKLKACNNMLNAFVFVYGGDLIFKPFNELYAKQKYQKVMHITASALIELRRERKKKSTGSPLHKTRNNTLSRSLLFRYSKALQRKSKRLLAMFFKHIY